MTENEGLVALGVIGATLFLYDVWAVSRRRQTLSSAIWKINEHPLRKLIGVAAWAALTYHLFAEARDDA